MKKMFLVLLGATLLLTACEDYGKSVKINEKSEVFYKGEGVNESEAKNLGDFLLKQQYFNTQEERTVQLMKEGDSYVVKFIVDQEKIKQQDSATVSTGFKVWHMWIQDNVFNGAKVKLVLADEKLNDLREVGQFTAEEKAQINAEEQGTGTSSQLSSDSANSDPSVNADTQTNGNQ